MVLVDFGLLVLGFSTPVEDTGMCEARLLKEPIGGVSQAGRRRDSDGLARRLLGSGCWFEIGLERTVTLSASS